jgi:hypothetical protein
MSTGRATTAPVACDAVVCRIADDGSWRLMQARSGSDLMLLPAEVGMMPARYNPDSGPLPNVRSAFLDAGV